MVDISNKTNTLRTATAQALVRVSRPETIAAIENGTVPKGDVFAMSRAAGLLGVKKTPELLPDCHPLPIEYTGIEYRIEGLEIEVRVTIKTIYKTGVEVEAMHGASIVALNLYDMLKPIDKGIEIHRIKLLEKRGGKSDYKNESADVNAAVIVCSDSTARGEREDRSGKRLVELLAEWGVTDTEYAVVADEIPAIRAAVKGYAAAGTSLILLTGGTGLSPRDVTPEAIRPLLDRAVPGIEEAMRAHGQQRTPYAMLSRSVAGTLGASLVLALPGSTRGATESMRAIFPAVLHTFKIMKGGNHG